MSDLQLALIVKGYCARLERALDKVREQMPEDAEREHVPVYRGDPGSLTGRLFKENWEVTPTGEYLLLRPVVDLIDEMKAEARRLEGIGPVEEPSGERPEGDVTSLPKKAADGDTFSLTAPLPTDR